MIALEHRLALTTPEGYGSFSDFIRARHGSNWCLAQRLTSRLKDSGYTVALTPKVYDALKAEWLDGHPVVREAERIVAGSPMATLLAALVRDAVPA